MKYRYKKGDKIYIQKSGGRRSLIPRPLEIGPYIVKRYDPANPDPEKRLQVYSETVDSKKGVTYRTSPFFCNPETVRPENPHQELDTGNVVVCLRNSMEAKMALLMGDYPRYPALEKGDMIEFTHTNGLKMKGEVIGSVLGLKGIVVKVKVNGYKKIFEVDEVEATYMKPCPYKEKSA